MDRKMELQALNSARAMLYLTILAVFTLFMEYLLLCKHNGIAKDSAFLR